MGHASITVPRIGLGGSRSHRWTARIAIGGVAALFSLGAVVLARSLGRVEVVGGSMAPALLPGDRLLLLRRPLGPPGWPAVGDVVALADPREPTRVLVKRVAHIDRSAGTVTVLGDAAEASTDSRTFGAVPRRALLGRAVHRYGPAGRNSRAPWPSGYASR